jgi:plastocyanin
MIINGRSFVMGALLGSAMVAPSARAADDRPGPTWAEFQKLQNEVKEQRQLIIQLMQSEQQRYDMLLKLIQTGEGPAEKQGTPATAGAGGGGGPARAAGTVESTRTREPSRAVIEGQVRVSGGEAEAVYVYVDNFRGPPVRGRNVEIKQQGKQFHPTHAVVQIGTSLTFPNLDTIFHNVFSNSSKNVFDLGTFRSGPSPRAVVMTEPGVVDLQCNMHEQMRGSVLVVPSKLYTRVRPDGTFRLEGVPTGRRRVVAWGPNLKAARQMVELGPSGGRADFALEYTGPRVLPNKLGQPYGSYKE